MTFSIIIPVYNVAPYLRICLDSVLSQTYTDWEAICVDDGSTDSSGVILDKYATRDSRIQVIHQSNRGVAMARQVALNHCSGEWIASIDSDDWVEKDELSFFHNAVERNDTDMVWCDYFIVDGGENRRVMTRTEGRPDKHLEAILSDKIWGSLCNRVISKKFIDQYHIGFPPKGCDHSEDMAFCCDVLKYGPRIKWIDSCCYHYIQRSGSLMHGGSKHDSFTPTVRTFNYICENLHGFVNEELLVWNKQRLKFGAYSSSAIPDELFYSAFPEIQALTIFKVPIWHRVLFFWAVRGWRHWIVWLLNVIRSVRCKR